MCDDYGSGSDHVDEDVVFLSVSLVVAFAGDGSYGAFNECDDGKLLTGR